MKNDHIDEINKKDNIENLISLSDRFGIWLGFHNFNQENFLKIVFFHAKFYKLDLSHKDSKRKSNRMVAFERLLFWKGSY